MDSRSNIKWTMVVVIYPYQTPSNIKPFLLLLLFLLLFYWTLVCEMCPNYEVVMLQPQKRTPPDLGSIANCYVAILLSTARSFPPVTWCLPGRGLPDPKSSLYPLPTVLFPHRIIRLPRRHLYLAQHTKFLWYLNQNPLPPQPPALATPYVILLPRSYCCKNIF